MVSNRFSLFMLLVLIEVNEKRQETMSNKATTEVISSIILPFERLVKRRDVMTIRQKPSRLADVFKICCDVLLGMVAR